MRDEKKLIRKIKYRKDREAANELICRYYQEIFAYVFRQVGERELALDLSQEIFLSVLRGVDGFDEKKAGFRTWLYRIASNKITDYYRSRYHRQKKREVPLAPMETPGFVTERQGSARDRDTEAEEDILLGIVQKEMVYRVMQIAAEYEREWMIIFQKKIFLDYSFARIAEELKIPESTVKSRYYQMIRRIREEMEQDERCN